MAFWLELSLRMRIKEGYCKGAAHFALGCLNNEWLYP